MAVLWVWASETGSTSCLIYSPPASRWHWLCLGETRLSSFAPQQWSSQSPAAVSKPSLLKLCSPVICHPVIDFLKSPKDCSEWVKNRPQFPKTLTPPQYLEMLVLFNGTWTTTFLRCPLTFSGADDASSQRLKHIVCSLTKYNEIVPVNISTY